MNEKPITTPYPLNPLMEIKKRAEKNGKSFNAEVIFEIEEYGKSQIRQPRTENLAQLPDINEKDLQMAGELAMEEAWERYSL